MTPRKTPTREPNGPAHKWKFFYKEVVPLLEYVIPLAQWIRRSTTDRETRGSNPRWDSFFPGILPFFSSAGGGWCPVSCCPFSLASVLVRPCGGRVHGVALMSTKASWESGQRGVVGYWQVDPPGNFLIETKFKRQSFPFHIYSWVFKILSPRGIYYFPYVNFDLRIPTMTVGVPGHLWAGTLLC